jgi:YVTN family beta-propeller protein
VDEKRHRIFVANAGSNNVSVIDGGSSRVLATIPAGSHPYAVAVDADHGDAFAADYGAQPVTRLDLSSLPH